MLFKLMLRFRSDSKSDFCAYPIGIRSYLASVNGKKSHEIGFLQIRFELSDVTQICYFVCLFIAYHMGSDLFDSDLGHFHVWS